jgi:hypothetical protein
MLKLNRVKYLKVKLKNQMFLNRKLKVTYAYNKYVNNNDIVNLFDNKLNLI